VADAGSSREPDRVAGLQPVQVAVDPGVGMAFEHEDELLLGALGVGIGGAPAGRQPFVVDADAGQASLRPSGAPMDISSESPG